LGRAGEKWNRSKEGGCRRVRGNTTNNSDKGLAGCEKATTQGHQ